MKINERDVIVPAAVVKAAAKTLGMVDPDDDQRVLAALDDYFKTLNDGQYSPLSGEHNNATNRNEVYEIAKKHGVDPEKMMRYLTDVAVFDKFQKLAVSEASHLTENGLISPTTVDKVMRMFFKKGHDKHMLAAIKDFHKSQETRTNTKGLLPHIAHAYGIDPRVFANYLRKFNKEAQMIESNEPKGFEKVLREFEERVSNTGDEEVDEAKRKKPKRSSQVNPDARKQDINNTVARHGAVNRGSSHKSKKDYRRTTKHKGRGMEEGYSVLPELDRDRFPNREQEGLEGPFQSRHGKVYYYDRKEGKYYDSTTDLYLEPSDIGETIAEKTTGEELGIGSNLTDENGNPVTVVSISKSGLFVTIEDREGQHRIVQPGDLSPERAEIGSRAVDNETGDVVEVVSVSSSGELVKVKSQDGNVYTAHISNLQTSKSVPVQEGKQRSVYEAHLMKFLEQQGAVFEQGEDCIYVEQTMIEAMGEKFPEFGGMMKPLSEYAGDNKPQGFNSDKYVTVADGDAQQYSGTDKGVGG